MRLFVAMDLTPEVRERIATFLAKLRATYPVARWVRAENLHVTLKFIGEVNESRVAAFRAALSEIHSSEFAQMDFRGAGFFPNDKRPRVFWIGIQASANVSALAAEIDEQFAAFGVERDTREFRPHLTLARFDDARNLDVLHAAIEKSRDSDFGQRPHESISSLSKPDGGGWLTVHSARQFYICSGRKCVTPESLNQWWWLALAAYLLGSIPFGYLVARRAGLHDIRESGSGNIGATNVARTLGAGAGALTFFLDTAKGFLAVWLAAALTHFSVIWMVVAAVGAVLGHVYPLWLGGKGGRGVATAAGAFVLICWPAVIAAVAIWIAVLFAWRYVSLASIAAAAALPLLTYLLYAREFAPPRAVSIGVTLTSMLVLWRHRENLGRLATGTESRITIRRERN